MSLAGARALGRPVRPRVVLHRFGRIALTLSGLAAIPAVVAFATGDIGFGLRCAAMCGLVLVVAWQLHRIHAPEDVRGNEALVIVALVFLAAALLMTWPFMAAGIDPLDAFFEAVSGITTTGLSTLSTVEHRPAAFLFARAWTQWYGGLAIIALAFAFTIGPGPAARRLASIEGQPEDLVSTTRLWARRALTIYGVLTILGILLILPFGLSPLDTVAQVLAAISTGGFATHDASIAALGGWPVQAVLLLIALAGAISFTLYDQMWRRGWRSLFADVGVRTLVVLLATASVLLFVEMVVVGGRSWTESLTLAPMLATTAQSTTGFAPTDIAALDPGSKLVLILTMFIGGDSGSTAGGIKIVRLLLILRLLQVVFLRATLPRGAVIEIEIGGRRFAPADVQATLGIALLYIAAAVVSWLAFVLDGAPALDSLFDVVSALSTTGLSAGVVTPALAPALKAVLCLDMLMGRLEIIAFLVLVYPGTWLGRRSRAT